MQNLTKKSTKPLTQLKNIQNEHFAKLQTKHAAETELLDNLRLFCKQRAIIERDYAQSLQKLVNTFTSRKELTCPPAGLKESADEQNAWRVWYRLLEESNNFAMSRLQFSETQRRIHRDLKPLKLRRVTVNKRVFEQLKTMQGDLAICVQEMVKSHKVYMEEEKQARDTRLKVATAEEKIRRKSKGIFYSMAQLHRNFEKLVVQRQAYDARSVTARNEYLFQLAAINAHLKHYFTKDIPHIVKTLDGDLYEKLRDTISELCQQEAESCAVTRDRLQPIQKDASQISRVDAWNNFLKQCPLFDKTVQYPFEPVEGDGSTLLRSPDIKEASLEQIAKKLARHLVIRERRIKSYENELKMLQSGSTSSQSMVYNSNESANNDDLVSFNQEYVEHKVEEVQFAIRREEIELVKVEACLTLLRNSSIDINQFVDDARLAADTAAFVQPLTPTPCLSLTGASNGSSSSERFSDTLRFASDLLQTRRSSNPNTSSRKFSSDLIQLSDLDSHYWSTTANPTGSNPNLASKTKNYQRSADRDYQNLDLGELLRPGDHAQRSNTVPAKESNSSDDNVDLELLWSDYGRLRQASVLHEFRAKRADELDLVVHETVVLLDQADSKGWIKVRSLIDGNEGLVPLNYLQLHEPVANQTQLDAPLLSNGKQRGSMDKLSESSSSSPSATMALSQACSKEPSSAVVVPNSLKCSITQDPPYTSDPKSEKATPTTGTFVHTLIEFNGTNSDELNFYPGSIIRVLGKAPAPSTTESTEKISLDTSYASRTGSSTVDDGWWEGELLVPGTGVNATYQRIKGVFPSMLVEPIPSKEVNYWTAIWEHSKVFTPDTGNPSQPDNHITQPTENGRIPDSQENGRSDGDYIEWNTESAIKIHGDCKQGTLSVPKSLLQHTCQIPPDEDIPIVEL